MLRLVFETVIGAVYGIGAVFNTVYTLAHGEDFYGGFARGAWLSPARRFVERVVLANPTPFTVLLILFQAGVAIMILARTDPARAALLAGAGFCVLAALVSSPGGTVANVALAAVQVILATG